MSPEANLRQRHISMNYFQKPSNTQPLRDVLPPEPRLLMGAGPVPIPSSVARANGVVINHLGRTMDQVIADMQAMARYVFQTTTERIIGVSGPSSAAMEMTAANLLWPGRTALVLRNGTFSNRFGEMIEAVGADVSYVDASTEPGAVTAHQVREVLERRRFDVVTITHGETSVGVLTTELCEIAKIAKQHGSLVVVDAVVTLGAMAVFMDEWGLDAVISGGQKALGSIPGISLVAFSPAAWDVIEHRTEPLAHWCLDARRAWQFWGHHQYHYTAPVPGVLATHEALHLIEQEKLSVRFLRHELSSLALQKGLEAMGIELYAPSFIRLNSVVSIVPPNDIDESLIRNHMAQEFGVEIAGAFNRNILRIGQMGEQCRAHNLFKTLYALGVSCNRHGAKLDIAKGLAVLEDNLVRDPDAHLT